MVLHIDRQCFGLIALAAYVLMVLVGKGVEYMSLSKEACTEACSFLVTLAPFSVKGADERKQ